MTFSEEERRRLVGASEEDPVEHHRFQRSGTLAATLGMLAGLGMLVFIAGVLTAGAILLDLQFDVIRIDGDLQQLTVIGLSIAAVVLFGSTFVGGFVAGRMARYGGLLIGLGSGLGLTLVVLGFAGLTWWLGALSGSFDGFDLADRLSRFEAAELTAAAAIAAGGLVLLALVGGLIGGRIGQTDARMTEKVVDIREVGPASEDVEANLETVESRSL